LGLFQFVRRLGYQIVHADCAFKRDQLVALDPSAPIRRKGAEFLLLQDDIASVAYWYQDSAGGKVPAVAIAGLPAD
jgi:hypothetical protein